MHGVKPLRRLTVLVLAGLATGVTQVTTGLSQADQFLEKPEAIAASERFAESFPAGTADPTVVITSVSDAGRCTIRSASRIGGSSWLTMRTSRWGRGMAIPFALNASHSACLIRESSCTPAFGQP